MTPPVMPSTEGGVDPKAIAKEIADKVVSRAVETGVIDPTPTPTPAPTPAPTPPPDPALTPTPTPPAEPGAVTPTPPAEPGATPPVEPVAVVTPEDAAAVAAETGASFEEVVDTLTGFGIAVETEGVPDDLRDRYGKLLEGVRSALTPVFERDSHNKAQIQQNEAFRTRLDEKPDSILLSLMVHKPEAFAKAMEIAERAGTDDEYKATIKREVELEARESHLTARETRFTEHELEEKGRRASVAVEVAARRHGIDIAVADRYIAGMVNAEGADFKLSDIDGYVSQLKPKATIPRPPPMVTPAAAAAAVTAPAAPAAGETPPAPPGTSSGLTTETNQPGRGGFLRSLIKDAGARVDRIVSP